LKNQKQFQVINRTKYQPIKKRNQTSHHKGSSVPSIQNGFFHGNLVQNMRFGGKNHDISGYVQRTLVMKDRNGNVMVGKEKQFFNSSKNGMRVRIKDDEKE